MMELLLPTSHEAENSVIGCLLLDSSKYENVCRFIINENVFSNAKNRTLWEKITQMIKKNKLVDVVSLCSELTERDKKAGIDPYYITGLPEEPSSVENIMEYAKIVYEKYLLRKIIVEAREIGATASRNGQDIYNILESTHLTIGDLISLRPENPFDIRQLLADTMDNIQNTDHTIPTGFAMIDSLFGGMTRGEITIVGGRPSHGKTTYAINLAKNLVSNGYKVLFFNREMTNVEMMNKLIIMESGNLSYKMLRNKRFTEGDLKEVEKTIKKIDKKYTKDKFFMFDNIRDFGTASSEIRRFKPDVVIDDYVQLINPITPTKDRRLQIEEIVNNYKWLCKRANCVVVLLSQLNRALETRTNPRPRLSDLAESGSLEQTAENVIFCYYDYKVNYEDSEKGKNCIELIASKVRYGESASVDMGFDGDKCTFSQTINKKELEEVSHL